MLLGACAQAGLDRVNFENCLEDRRACVESELSAAEYRQLLQARRQQHFEECLTGRRCDEASLTEHQLAQVRESVARANYPHCLHGSADCRHFMLTEAQKSMVTAAQAEKNHDRCLNGLTSCQRWALSPAQAAEAREAYLRRNFSACLNSVGTLLPCDSEALSEAQRQQVQERRIAVNLYICGHALMGCVEDWLTPEQKEKFAAVRARLAR